MVLTWNPRGPGDAQVLWVGPLLSVRPHWGSVSGARGWRCALGRSRWDRGDGDGQVGHTQPECLVPVGSTARTLSEGYLVFLHTVPSRSQEDLCGLGSLPNLGQVSHRLCPLCEAVLFWKPPIVLLTA